MSASSQVCCHRVIGSVADLSRANKQEAQAVSAPPRIALHACPLLVAPSHVKLAREDCPEFADFSLSNPSTTITSNTPAGNRATASYNSNSSSSGGAAEKKDSGGGGGNGGDSDDVRKTLMCKHWRNGTECPYRDKCHYAHGQVRSRFLPVLDALSPIPPTVYLLCT